MRGALEKLVRAHLGARMAGMVVNSSGWVDGDGYEELVHAAEVLGVDTFVVIADDRLFSRLSVRAAERARVCVRAPPARASASHSRSPRCAPRPA